MTIFWVFLLELFVKFHFNVESLLMFSVLFCLIFWTPCQFNKLGRIFLPSIANCNLSKVTWHLKGVLIEIVKVFLVLPFHHFMKWKIQWFSNSINRCWNKILRCSNIFYICFLILFFCKIFVRVFLALCFAGDSNYAFDLNPLSTIEERICR